MKTFRLLFLSAFLLLAAMVTASGQTKPRASVPAVQEAFNDAIELYNQQKFDEAETVFRKVVADSYKVDELLEIRLKSLQFLGFIDRDRDDYDHSNKWFKAASTVLSDYGNEEQKLRWGKVIANELHTNRDVIKSMQAHNEMLQEYRKKQIAFLSILLFLALLLLATFIVLFTNLRKAYLQLAARNKEWAETPTPAVPPTIQETNPLREKILGYIEGEKAYLNPDLCLEDLCKAVGSNRSYVSAEFGAMSTHFKAFVNECRIKEAIRIFSEKPQLDIDEVMEMSGFNSKTTFYSAFKEATGMSPAAFRNANQSKGLSRAI